jgi:hypothetical protein
VWCSQARVAPGHGNHVSTPPPDDGAGTVTAEKKCD